MSETGPSGTFLFLKLLTEPKSGSNFCCCRLTKQISQSGDSKSQQNSLKNCWEIDDVSNIKVFLHSSFRKQLICKYFSQSTV